MSGKTNVICAECNENKNKFYREGGYMTFGRNLKKKCRAYKLGYIKRGRTKRHKKLEAQITVMLSLMLSVLLIFLLTVGEGVHIHLGKGRATRNVMAAAENVMADYDIFLWENYRILALDEAYGTSNAEAVNLKMQEYFLNQIIKEDGKNLFSYSVDSLKLKDCKYLVEDIDIIKNQIREFMKYKIPEEKIDGMIKNLNMDVSEDEIEQAKSNLDYCEEKAAEKQQQTNNAEGEGEGIKKDEQLEGEKSSEKEKDPRKELKKLLKFGIVELVTKDTNISKEQYALADVCKEAETKSNFLKEEEKEEKEDFSFEAAKDVKNKLSLAAPVKTLTNEAVNEFFAEEYAVSYFDNYMTGQQDFSCQAEYLISGKASDYENMKSIINRIILQRFPLNYLYAVKTPELLSAANSMALAIAGATVNPAIVELISYLLLGCISYAESILDAQLLLSGEYIATIPTKATWQLSFSNMVERLSKGIIKTTTDSDMKSMENKAGMKCYEDYLKWFLFISLNKDKKYERMLNIMDYKGKQQRDGYDLKNMLYGFKLDIKVSMEPLFGSLVNAGEKDSLYDFSFKKVISY